MPAGRRQRFRASLRRPRPDRAQLTILVEPARTKVILGNGCNDGLSHVMRHGELLLKCQVLANSIDTLKNIPCDTIGNLFELLGNIACSERAGDIGLKNFEKRRVTQIDTWYIFEP